MFANLKMMKKYSNIMYEKTCKEGGEGEEIYASCHLSARIYFVGIDPEEFGIDLIKNCRIIFCNILGQTIGLVLSN